jgi:hypothetical protein
MVVSFLEGNQGDPPVLVDAMGKPSAHLAGGSQSIRSSEAAGNDRGAKGTQEGGSRTEQTLDKEPTQVPARDDWRRRPPGANDLIGTVGVIKPIY